MRINMQAKYIRRRQLLVAIIAAGWFLLAHSMGPADYWQVELVMGH